MQKEKIILFIEDNPDDAEHYINLLAECKNQYKVIHTDNSNEGIEIFKNQHIDCAIIDYNLPEVDGLEILDEMTNKSGKDYVATIILTGEPHQEIQAEAARKGALNYIAKDSNATADKLDGLIVKTISWAKQLNFH